MTEETKNKSNTFQTIGIATVVVLSLFLAYFAFNNSKAYKSEINGLNGVLDSLNKATKNRIDKDSILFYIEEQKSLDILISTLQIKIDSLKNKRYETTIINYNSLSADSNVFILSRNLLPLSNDNR